MSSSVSTFKRDPTCFVRACFGLPVPYTPVWIMRQAGRYLSEYQATRAKAGSFFELCESPQLVREVTLQPINKFHLDASIIFSDILVIPRVLGLDVQMVPGKGPSLPVTLDSGEDIDLKLDKIDENPDSLAKHLHSKLEYVYQGIAETVKGLDGRVPLIGFVGAPWTLMCYMVEGSGSKTFSKAKAWLYREPKAAHRLLALLTRIVSAHLIEQIRAGCKAVQVFDSWAGILSESCFNTFCLPYLAQIAADVRAAFPIQKTTDGDVDPNLSVPIIVFAKGAHYALSSLVTETLYDVISIDWTMEPSKARTIVHQAIKSLPSSRHRNVSLQGNLDPSALYAAPERIDTLAKEMLEQFGSKQSLVANLGHGMYPNHDPEHLRVYIDAIHKYSMEN
mmetsp:Transcript_9744/g.14695  ORF Transcript_9744/g.14695 Transcript_9744/m.14695 type:complete len:392 (+) Transcript_9744:31-1206(+)